MSKIKKCFGDLDITWKKLIISAIVAGVYTGIMAMLPVVRDTSFHDIAMTFEWWVLFGIIIIVNSKSAKEAALKCVVFFLISQPLVYLVQVPFNADGFGIFRFYPGWFKWTLLTIPMGYIGYHMKKDKWWGLFILGPMLLFVGFHYEGFLSTALSFFPNHILSAVFCVVTMIIYPLCIFENKKIRITGLAISIVIILVMTIVAFGNGKDFYNTTIMSSGNEGIEFDDSYTVYLTDEEYGEVYITYEYDTYNIYGEFKKEGETELVLESPDGTKTEFRLIIEKYSYDLILVISFTALTVQPAGECYS